MAAAGTLGRPADEFGNDSRVEALWAMKAMEQAEVYFNVSLLYAGYRAKIKVYKAVILCKTSLEQSLGCSFNGS